MLINILTLLLLNVASAMDASTFTIISVKPYSQQQHSLKASGIEYLGLADQCGDIQLDNSEKKEHNLALLDLSGQVLSINCNYCRNGIYLYNNTDNDGKPADFFTFTPPNGKYGSTAAVVDCLQKLDLIKDNIDTENTSVKITIDKFTSSYQFEGPTSTWTGAVSSVESGIKITDDVKFAFSKNKILEYQKKYPSIYFAPDYSIPKYSSGEIKSTLDFIQEYRNNIKKNDPSYLKKIKDYQKWYLDKNSNGRTTADFLINLSASVGTQSLAYYDQEASSYNGPNYDVPIPTPQALLTETKPILTEYANFSSLEKTSSMLAACSNIIQDSEHIVDNVLLSLRKYLKEDEPTQSNIAGVKLSLNEKPSYVAVIDKMAKDIGQVQLKNIFFGLLSNRYKFYAPTVEATNKSLIDKIIPAEKSDLKKSVYRTFTESSILMALSDANEEYKTLVANADTKPLFEHSKDIQKDITKDFNSEIKRMNATCKVVNKLYSDLQTGTKNPDLKKIKEGVEEKFDSDLLPTAIVVNEDGSFQSAQNYNINEQQKATESNRAKIKDYLGEKKYNELRDIAYGIHRNDLLSKGATSANTTYEFIIPLEVEDNFDQLLTNELNARLAAISNKITKKGKISKGQLRLPTDEEWEINQLLYPDQKNNLSVNWNKTMVDKAVAEKLKKITTELVLQSSYKLANTKFVHLLLVEDFRSALRMNGTGDVIQDRCFNGDGQLFNEATVETVKKAIKGYQELSLSAAEDLVGKLEQKKPNALVRKSIAGVSSEDPYYKEIDFIKDSLKTSPLVIADLLRTKHNYRYEELLCLYIKEINIVAANKEIAIKALFWTGMTASLAATVISGGSLGFTVPAMVAEGIGTVALATDILFVTAEGLEAWDLYTLKEGVRKKNSAYYDSVQNTLMNIDMLNAQKGEAIQSAVIMAVIGSLSPATKLVKGFFGTGSEIMETVAKDGTRTTKEIRNPYVDKKTGHFTKIESTTVKTGDNVNKEVVKTTKTKLSKTEQTTDAANKYKRTTVWENSPTGTTRVKTKTLVKKSDLQEVADVPNNTPQVETSTIYRNNETVPTQVKETVHTNVTSTENGTPKVTTTTIREESTTFTNEQILETNRAKLGAKNLILEQYNNGEIFLNEQELAKLRRDIATLECKIKSLLDKTEVSRLTIKDKEVTLEGDVTTEHKVVSNFQTPRYKFENPSEQVIESSTESIRARLAKIGIKGDQAEPIIKQLGKNTARFSNFLEQTRICRAMAKDNTKFTQYANATALKLASSKFLAGGSTSAFMYWDDNHNWGELNSDIGGDVVGQFIKAFGGAKLTTASLLGKKGSEVSIYKENMSSEVYRQNLQNTIQEENGFWKRARKAGIRAGAWSMATKVVSGAIYFSNGGAEQDYGEDAMYASEVRLGYGLAWAIPSTALEVTLQDFIIGATCVIPGAKVLATVSNGKLKAINFVSATTIQFLYPLLTNWFYYHGRGWTYDAFGLKKKPKVISSQLDPNDLNNVKAEFTTLDKYNDDYTNGNIEKDKSYVIEIGAPENAF